MIVSQFLRLQYGQFDSRRYARLLGSLRYLVLQLVQLSLGSETLSNGDIFALVVKFKRPSTQALTCLQADTGIKKLGVLCVVSGLFRDDRFKLLAFHRSDVGLQCRLVLLQLNGHARLGINCAS